jgi:hypothetical protein
MKVRILNHPALRFLVYFAFWQVAGLIVLSSVGGIYNDMFRSVGTLIYGRNDRVKEINFEPLSRGDHLNYTRVVIVNPALMQPDGSGPVRNLDIGMRGFGSTPLALLAGLILASPISWQRRGKALLWGIFWQQLLVFLTLGYCIWLDSAEIGLISLSPTGKELGTGIKNAIAGTLAGATPVLLWVLVTFRREDGVSVCEWFGASRALAVDPDSR